METVEEDTASSSRPTEGRPSSSEASSAAGQKRLRPSRYGMYEDVEEIMYGYGDSWRPSPDSVELMEKMAVQYIRELCARAMQVSSLTGGKIDKECLLFQVSGAIVPEATAEKMR